MEMNNRQEVIISISERGLGNRLEIHKTLEEVFSICKMYGYNMIYLNCG
mgnify:CR=1 FL=1